MARRFNLKTHQTVKRGDHSLRRVHPYVRISVEGAPAVFIQDGLFYSEGGEVYPNDMLPPAFFAELGKLSREARASVGLGPDNKPLPPIGGRPAVSPLRGRIRPLGDVAGGPTPDQVIDAATDAGRDEELGQDLAAETEADVEGQRQAVEGEDGEAEKRSTRTERNKRR